MWSRRLLWGLILGTSLFGGCGGDEPPPPPADPLFVPAACRDVPIDAFKELAVVDDAVLGDVRASNANNGPWSFRRIVESLVPEGQPTSDFVASWINSFKVQTTVNQFEVPARTDDGVNARLACPWLRARPENQCNADCSECAERVYDLAKAPFRLIAITNRIDLRETSAYLDGTGEGRFVYAATLGPADDPASAPIRMTAGFEFFLPTSLTPREWAERWHALGSHASFDEAYKAALEEITTLFLARDPKTGLAEVHQVRTNEREFDWQWELREFKIDPSSGQLALHPTFNTPDKSLNGSAELAAWVRENREAILMNRHVVPNGMVGGFAQPLEPWSVSVADREVVEAFAKQTCDGCHQTMNQPVDINFHVSPFKLGAAKLSPFLNDPAAPIDELRRRAIAMRRVLCSE